MHKPSWLSTNVNLTSLMALGGLIYAVISGVAGIQNEITTLKQDRDERSKVIDATFADIKGELSGISKRFQENNVPYRLQELERRQQQQEQRLDRQMDSFDNKLEVIRRDVNSVGTQVQVLGQKIDSLNPQAPRRTGVERRAEIDTTP